MPANMLDLADDVIEECVRVCLWPIAEMPAGAGHGRLLGGICRKLERPPLDICDNPTQVAAAIGGKLNAANDRRASRAHKSASHTIALKIRFPPPPIKLHSDDSAAYDDLIDEATAWHTIERHASAAGYGFGALHQP
jgi:hypothetical protein